jgi:hypothetical protein
MPFANWRRETWADEFKFVSRIGVVGFGGLMACFFCFAYSTTKGLKWIGFYPLMTMVCLLGGYIVGKAMWRVNKWFERVDRAVAYLEANEQQEQIGEEPRL